MVREKLTEILDVDFQHFDVVGRFARVVVLGHVDLDDRPVRSAYVHQVGRYRRHLELRLDDRDRLGWMGGLRWASLGARWWRMVTTGGMSRVHLHVA